MAATTPTSTTGTASATETRRVLGPLTTAFAPPSYCQNLIANCDLCTLVWQAQSCGSNGIESDDIACWPPTTANAPKASQPFGGLGLYSPGLACPTNYVPACSKTEGEASGFTFKFPLVSSETAIGCCPTGYSCTTLNGGFQTCQTVVSTSTSILVGTCLSDEAQYAFRNVPLTTISAGSSVTTTMTESVYILKAPMIQIVWQSSDTATGLTTVSVSASRSAETRVPNTIGSTAATTSAVSTAGTGDLNATTPSSTSGSSLSTGAAAGIGVGGAAVIILIAGISFFLWRRASKRRRKADALPMPQMQWHAQSTEGPYSQSPEGPYSQSPEGPYSPSTDIHTPKYSELASNEKKTELPGTFQFPPVELSADDSHWTHAR